MSPHGEDGSDEQWNSEHLHPLSAAPAPGPPGGPLGGGSGPAGFGAAPPYGGGRRPGGADPRAPKRLRTAGDGTLVPFSYTLDLLVCMLA